jgi:hypothetical protein
LDRPSNTTVTGNWFHDNGDGSGGCMCHGANPDNETITNNVFASTGYFFSIVAGDGDDNWLISHNVFYKHVEMNDPSPNGTGNVIHDNVFPGAIITDSCSGVSYAHNLNSGRSGTGKYQRDSGVRCESLVGLLPLPTRLFLTWLPRRQRRQEHGDRPLDRRLADEQLEGRCQ